MSTILSPSTTLTWKQADDHVHVATRDGEFAGFVEFDGRTHLARDGRGAEIGAFASLADARHALENARRTSPEALRVRLRRQLRRVRV